MANERSGHKGKVKVGAVDLNVTGWNLQLQSEILDTTHTGGNGWASNIKGVKSGEGSFTANWDALNPPNGTPPALLPGDAVTMELQIGEGPEKLGPFSGRIASVAIASAVRGLVNYTANFTVDGAVPGWGT